MFTLKATGVYTIIWWMENKEKQEVKLQDISEAAIMQIYKGICSQDGVKDALLQGEYTLHSDLFNPENRKSCLHYTVLDTFTKDWLF